jgi:pyruvate formate lyase activating enzyme
VKGPVFDIQHYAVHDGPGIRTLVFLKGCPLRCQWCSNPESWRSAPELRHRVVRCTGCLACVAGCPHGGAEAGGGSSPRPLFARAICASCPDFACVKCCPEGALAVWGEELTVEAVLARVLADREFYQNSGGGVTFSGGEPLAQPEFLLALLAACRAEGISTAVSTCGAVPREVLEAAEPLTDLFLFDVKHLDSEAHRRLTGQGNEEILDNLRWLAGRRPDDIVVRMPLVPGVNDSPQNLKETGDLLAALGLTRFELLPYHELGASKYEELGLGVTVPDAKTTGD